MKMSYESFLRANLIKRQKADFKQISYQLKRALRDLKTAKATIKIDLTWSLTIAYHAMIRAGRALIYSKGYLPTTNQSHKTIVEITKIALGEEYSSLVSKFNRMRRRRHDFIYSSKNHITHNEAISSLQTAKELIDRIIALVREDNPERQLF